MTGDHATPLKPRTTRGAAVSALEEGWRLSIPAGAAGAYRWAQLDDYMELPRSKFCWQGQLQMSLQARVSGSELTGTWGFGFWNDPFNASLGIGGTARRLPALPNAAWYFFASTPNFLTFHDRHPGAGFLAAVFSAPVLPWLAYAVGLPFLPLLAWPAAARLARRAVRKLVMDDGMALAIDPQDWHNYRLRVACGRVGFEVDGLPVFETPFAPRGRLGVVIWMDNQFAEFRPDGRLRFGTLETPQAAWMEIRRLSVEAE